MMSTCSLLKIVKLKFLLSTYFFKHMHSRRFVYEPEFEIQLFTYNMTHSILLLLCSVHLTAELVINFKLYFILSCKFYIFCPLRISCLRLISFDFRRQEIVKFKILNIGFHTLNQWGVLISNSRVLNNILGK